MVHTERLLQIHIAGMVALAAIMLGMSQQTSALPTLVIFAAGSSLCFTDWLGWFRLNRKLAEVLAIVALGFSFRDYIDGRSDGQLMAIANLLIYLQMILFFQKKNNRIYWQLTVLSLLQVVVASAMNVGLEFGGLLLAYMLLTFSALAVFFVHRETLRMQAAQRASSTSDGAAATKSPTGEQALRWQTLVSGRNLAVGEQDPEYLVRRLLGWRFLRQVALMSLMTLVFTLVMFYSLPRRGLDRRVTRRGHQSVVGFTKEVTLDEMGEIIQSDAPAMRVSFRQGDAPYEVRGTPYFRGAVMARYLSNQVPGKTQAGWRPLKRPDIDDVYPERLRRDADDWIGWEMPRSTNSPSLVMQELVVEPTNDTVLFSTFPALRVAETAEEVNYFPVLGQIRRKGRPESTRVAQFRYVLGTTAYRNGFQAWVIPHEMAGDNPRQKKLLDYELYRLRFFPSVYRQWFPELTRIAAQIVRDEKAAGSDTMQIARALQNHFRTQNYKYSLDFSKLRSQRNPKIDPVEDFVANHRTGHCEYFASALTLMLRSQGIPARLVLGYKGGEYNSVGNYYQVRSLHAHAWVEAHLTAEEARDYLRPEFEVGESGAWLRLDPTPLADRDPTSRNDEGILAKVDETLDYAQLLWSEYVLDLNPEDHGQLASRAPNALGEFLDDPHWPDLWHLMRRERQAPDAEASRGWLPWRMLSAGVVGILVLLCVLRACLSGGAIFRRLRLKPHAWKDGSYRPGLEFYRRFEKRLARAGLRRQSAQTQREFARELSATWKTSAARPQRDAWVDLIVSAFYRVRFGGDTLDKAELEAIEQALIQLDSSLKDRPGNNFHGPLAPLGERVDPKGSATREISGHASS